MLIKMLATAAGPDAVYRAGETVDIDRETAKEFIAGGYAVAAKEDLEAAAVEVEEKAVMGAAKKKMVK